jgi:uncharacterized protein (DUF2267 family)
MSGTGLAVFDSTVQKTNIWLDDIMHELQWNHRERAYHALRAVLHTLRDHLTIDEAVQLAAQLPLLIRGMYYDGWKPSRVPVKERRWDQFVAHVAEAFALDPDADAAKVTEAVFGVMSRHMTEGEIADVKRCLPENLRSHWPSKG